MAKAEDRGWLIKFILAEVFFSDIAVKKVTTFSDAPLLSPEIPLEEISIRLSIWKGSASLLTTKINLK